MLQVLCRVVSSSCTTQDFFSFFVVVLTLNVECGYEGIVSLVDDSHETVLCASVVFHYCLVDTVAKRTPFCTSTANLILLCSEAKQSFPALQSAVFLAGMLTFHAPSLGIPPVPFVFEMMWATYRHLRLHRPE